MKIRRAAEIVKNWDNKEEKIDLFDVFIDYYFNSQNLTEIIEYPEMININVDDFRKMCGIEKME